MSSSLSFHPLIVILGLEKAGKTTFVYRLKTDEFIKDIQPTIGYEISIIHKDDMKFDVVDLGGHEAFRTTFWKNFVSSCKGCIFIFDRSGKENLLIAKEWLWKVEEWIPKDAIFAFFANKSDLKDTLSLEEIVKGLELKKFSLSPLRSFRIFETSNVTGENINECWNWLTDSIRKRVESKFIVDIKAFEIFDDKLDVLVREFFVPDTEINIIKEVSRVFQMHSLKMIDRLPYINIQDYVIHIVRKGDYYATIYTSKNDDFVLSREIGLSLLFNSLSKIKREQQINKETLQEIIGSIVFS